MRGATPRLVDNLQFKGFSGGKDLLPMPFHLDSVEE